MVCLVEIFGYFFYLAIVDNTPLLFFFFVISVHLPLVINGVSFHSILSHVLKYKKIVQHLVQDLKP